MNYEYENLYIYIYIYIYIVLCACIYIYNCKVFYGYGLYFEFTNFIFKFSIATFIMFHVFWFTTTFLNHGLLS
jgi:hypothetical protein